MTSSKLFLAVQTCSITHVNLRKKLIRMTRENPWFQSKICQEIAIWFANDFKFIQNLRSFCQTLPAFWRFFSDRFPLSSQKFRQVSSCSNSSFFFRISFKIRRRTPDCFRRWLWTGFEFEKIFFFLDDANRRSSKKRKCVKIDATDANRERKLQTRNSPRLQKLSKLPDLKS